MVAVRRPNGLVLVAVFLSFVVLWVHTRNDPRKGSILLSFGKKRESFTPIHPRRDVWDRESIPTQCKNLKENPIPFPYGSDRKLCGRMQTTEDFRCLGSGLTFLSANSQDYLLYTMHFRFLKRPGNYLDVATNDPIWNSNTFFFDHCLGWSGVCVEAQNHHHEPIRRMRTCSLIPTCVSDVEGRTVTFIMYGGGSGIESTHRSQALKNNKAVGRRTLKCTTLRNELRRYGAPLTIDYMSLDVEGHELPILRSIDWNITKANVMTIETTAITYTPISTFMKSIGYRELTDLPDGRSVKTVLGSGEIIFLAPGVEFGSPV